MLGLLSTINRGRKQVDPKMPLMERLLRRFNIVEHLTTSARGVARTSARRLDHPARAGIFVDFLSPPPIPHRRT